MKRSIRPSPACEPFGPSFEVEVKRFNRKSSDRVEAIPANDAHLSSNSFARPTVGTGE